MIFDSQKQKDAVLDLIGKVPITTTIQGLVAGLAPELAFLIQRIQQAPVISADEQASMLLTWEALESNRRSTEE